MKSREAVSNLVAIQTEFGKKASPIPEVQEDPAKPKPSEKATKVAGILKETDWGCHTDAVYELMQAVLGEPLPSDEPVALPFKAEEIDIPSFSALIVIEKKKERFVIFRRWDSDNDLQYIKRNGDRHHVDLGDIYGIRYATSGEIEENLGRYAINALLPEAEVLLTASGERIDDDDKEETEDED